MTTDIAELSPVPGTTLTEFVLAQAPDRGAKSALVDALSGRALSYAGLAAEVRALAGGLAAKGVPHRHAGHRNRRRDRSAR
jgi:non-ribosomal peptide synthetase component E (peptide arylation enzyme)